MKKIFLDTQRSRVISVDSYEEDGEYVYAKLGPIVRKIQMAKIAYIEEDLRIKDKKEAEPVTAPRQEQNTQPQMQPQMPMPVMSKNFTDVVERYKNIPPVMSMGDSIPALKVESSNVTMLTVIISGAENKTFKIPVPVELIQEELDERLTRHIFDNNEIHDALKNLKFLRFSKNGDTVVLVTEHRAPVTAQVNSSTLASQFANLSGLAGNVGVGRVLPNIPMNDEK